MVDMRGNELKEGDLVIFVQKSSVSKCTEGTMNFGVISKFYKGYFDQPVCSVTLVSGKNVTNVMEARILKVESIINQYNQIKDTTNNLQDFLEAMSISK